MTPSVEPSQEHSGLTGNIIRNPTSRRRSASCTPRLGQPFVREDNFAVRNEPLSWEVLLAQAATEIQHSQAINYQSSDHFQDLNSRRSCPPKENLHNLKTSNMIQATAAGCYPDQPCWKQVIQDSAGASWCVHWHRLEAKETASCSNEHQKHTDKSLNSSPLDTKPGKPDLWETPTRKPYNSYGTAMPLTPPSTDRSIKTKLEERSPLRNRPKRMAVSPRRPIATSTAQNDSSQTTDFVHEKTGIEDRPSSSSSVASSSISVASSSTSVDSSSASVNGSSFAAEEWLDVFTNSSGDTTTIMTTATTHHGNLEHGHPSTTEKVEVAAVIPSQIKSLVTLKDKLGVDYRQCLALTQKKQRCTRLLLKATWGNIEQIFREVADLMNSPTSNKLEDCMILIKKLSEMVHCKRNHQKDAPAKLQSWEPIIIEAWNRSIEEKTSAQALCHVKVEESTSASGDTSAEETVTCNTNIFFTARSISCNFLGSSSASKIRTLTLYVTKVNKRLTTEEIVKEQVKKPLTKRDEQVEGEVYIYWVLGNFGLVKIGWTQKSVDSRLNGWYKKCGHLPWRIFPTKYVTKPIPHAKRVEMLIHAELNGVRRRETSCDKCGRSHVEWFEVSHAKAVAVAEKWTAWMLKEPYADNGQLKDPTAKLPELEDLSSHEDLGTRRYDLRPRARHTSSTQSHAQRRSPRFTSASPRRHPKSVGASL
ncbi:MAG: hypothetical protein Q9167_004804 [Letrouitia subvulpina]